MQLVAAFLLVFGSFIVLRLYGLNVRGVQEGESVVKLLNDPRTLAFSVMNLIALSDELPANFKSLDFFSALREAATGVFGLLLGSAIVLWLIYGIMSLFGRKPAEEEDINEFKANRKEKAFWWYIAIDVALNIYFYFFA